MSTTIKLDVHQDVIETAEAYAHQNGRELEDLIEAYLRELSTRYHSTMRSMTRKAILTDALMGKYCG